MLHFSSTQWFLVGMLCLVPAKTFAQPGLQRDEDVPLPAGALARVGELRLQHTAGVRRLAFTPDGSRLASLDQNRNYHLWEAKTGKELHYLPHQGSPPSGPMDLLHHFPRGRMRMQVVRMQRMMELHHEEAAGFPTGFSPDGSLLAVGNQDGTIQVWDTAKTLRYRFEAKGVQCTALAFSPDGKVLAAVGVGQEAQHIYLWDLPTSREKARLKMAPGRWANQLIFSANGLLLAGACSEEIHLWDLTTNKRIRVYQGHESEITSLCFFPDSKQLASAGGDGTIRLWEVDSVEEVARVGEGEMVFWSLAISPDGRTLASASEDTHIRLWDLTTRKETRQLTGHKSPATCVTFSPDGRTLASASSGGRIRLWDVGKGTERFSASPLGELMHVAFQKEVPLVTVGSRDGSLCEVDVSKNKIVRQFAGPKQANFNIAFSPDGKTVALVNEEAAHIMLWDLIQQKEIRRLEGNQATFLGVVFGPQGKLLASVDAEESRVQLWDVGKGKVLYQLGAEGSGECMAFSPNGKILATVDMNNHVHLWETATGKERSRFQVNQSGVTCLAFSPDGRWLATGSEDETIRLWDPASGKMQRGFLGHRGSVQVLAFSPDGKRLASGGPDRTVRIWDLATGEELHEFAGHRGDVLALAYSADGKKLISGSKDRTAVVWDLTIVQRKKPLSRAAVTPGQLAVWWDELPGEGTVAYRAMCKMVDSPQEAAEFLESRLHPVPVVEAKQLLQLIGQLDHQRFTVRDKARKELEKLGSQTIPVLRKALENKPSAELRKQIETLLSKLEDSRPTAEHLGMIRAIEVLEQIGTVDAKKLLGRLAKGAPGARVTEEARATLQRLDRASPQP